MGIWSLFFRYVLFATPIAIIIIASFRYLRREKSTDAKLLFLGSSMTFLSYTFNSLLFSLFGLEDSFIINTYDWILVSSGILGLLGIFLFAFGFLLLIGKYSKHRKEAQNEVDEIGKR